MLTRMGWMEQRRERVREQVWKREEEIRRQQDKRAAGGEKSAQPRRNMKQQPLPQQGQHNDCQRSRQKGRGQELDLEKKEWKEWVGVEVVALRKDKTEGMMKRRMVRWIFSIKSVL